MNCVQIRSGNSTTLICTDPSGTKSYNNLTEPATVNATAPYEEDQKLAPGLYQLLPRETVGTALPKGSPVYTTPGQPAGTIITPSGRIRGVPLPAGPHVGTIATGCLLFPPTKEGKRELEDFYQRFNKNIDNGGTWIFIIDFNIYKYH